MRVCNTGFVLPLAALAAASVPAQSDAFRVGVLTWDRSPGVLRSLEGLRTGFAVWQVEHSLDVVSAGGSLAVAHVALEGFRKADVDFVLAVGTEAAVAAVDAVADRPVVFTAVLDPVGAGIAKSMMGSRLNVAGNSQRVNPVEVMRAFKLAMPGMRRLGMLRSAGAEGRFSEGELTQVRLALKQPGSLEVEVVDRIVQPDERDEAAFRGVVGELLRRGGLDAVWIPHDVVIEKHASTVFAEASKRRVAVLASAPEPVRAGYAIVGVEADREMLAERCVQMVREIVVTGVDPGRVPIGMLHGVRIVVNLAPARAAGVELPLPLLIAADPILDTPIAQGSQVEERHAPR